MIELASLAILCFLLVLMGVIADYLVEPWLDRRDARNRAADPQTWRPR